MKSRAVTILTLLLFATLILAYAEYSKETPVGLFRKLKSMIMSEAKADSSETDGGQDADMITVYDKYGRKMLIAKKEWRKNVLPGTLRGAWDNPDELYNLIVLALKDEFVKDVEEASRRILEIDSDLERSHTVRAIVLMKLHRLDEAEAVLTAYIKTEGTTGTILTNLAKVYADRGDEDLTDETLWRAIELDPNMDNGIGWYAVIQKEREGEGGFQRAMEKVATLKGSWRAQLWLARSCLQARDLDAARQHYTHVLTQDYTPDALTMISGDLGQNGYIEEIVPLIKPVFDPNKHEVMTGLNLLQAYLEKGNHVEGQELLNQMHALNRPDFVEHLAFYSNEYDKLRQSEQQQSQNITPEPKIEGVSLEKPVWLYGIDDPKWLLKKDASDADGVLFLTLANTSPHIQNGEARQQREDDLGRLTRSIPLYLAESTYFWTDLSPSVMVPVVRGSGPVVSGKEWEPEVIFNSAKGNVSVAVTGYIRQEDDRIHITLRIWDIQSKTEDKVFQRSLEVSQIGEGVLQLESDLLSYLQAHKLPTAAEAFYRRPSQSEIDPYLVALGQTFIMTLIQNEYTDKDGLWGERNMLGGMLNLAINDPSWQIPRIMFLAGINKSKAYGSKSYLEFRQQAAALVEDEADRSSAFCRLAPLIFRAYEMNEEFETLRSDLKDDSDPIYSEWLDGLK